MGQEFLRRITGYNRPYFQSSFCVLPRDTSIIQVSHNGPGVLEIINIMISDIDIYTPIQNYIQLDIDGDVIINTLIHYLIPCCTINSFNGPCGTYNRGTHYSGIQIMYPFDFEITASVIIKNTSSPDPTEFYLSIIGKVGR